MKNVLTYMSISVVFVVTFLFFQTNANQTENKTTGEHVALAAQTPLSESEATEIAHSIYGKVDHLLMTTADEHGWWESESANLALIEEELLTVVNDQIYELIEHNLDHIFCACDSSVWVPLEETNRFQVIDYNENEIQASFYQFPSAMAAAGTTYLTFTNEDGMWKLTDMDWSNEPVNVTKDELEFHLEKKYPNQERTIYEHVVNDEKMYLYQVGDREWEAIRAGSGDPVFDIPEEWLAEVGS
ncbi:hypothetical protein [Shouchella patagoniensis]|uniref:hypothetical protein n=1 Tax=Shouchella patagoniensis TaxID=228576 RepID=UPI000994BD6B|nr:hypothetical protein [Shouchella patagoniensis]